MKTLTVKFKKLHKDAVIPTKAHPTDFGADLTITSRHIDDYCNEVYGFGIAVEIPEGYVGLLFPRSSNARKDLLLSNSVGVIDCHYRGEIMAKFKITSIVEDRYSYRVGDKPVQLAIIPYPEVVYEEADELSETDRGEGGYGSTGQ